MWYVNRSADFLPIPGNLANSLTNWTTDWVSSDIGGGQLSVVSGQLLVYCRCHCQWLAVVSPLMMPPRGPPIGSDT